MIGLHLSNLRPRDKTSFDSLYIPDEKSLFLLANLSLHPDAYLDKDRKVCQKLLKI